MKLGSDAIHKSGIQKTFAKCLASLSVQLGPLALRVPQKPCQRHEEGALAKSPAIRTKTSNWGPMCGHIPLDHRFSRIDRRTGKLIYPTPRLDLGIDRRDPDCSAVQEIITLNNLLSRVGTKFRITRYDPNTSLLAFAANTPYANADFDGEFVIYLNDKDHEQDENAFPVFIQDAQCPQHNPTPLLIYANASKIPFTSDWDMLWVGIPMNTFPTGLFAMANTPIHTRQPGQLAVLTQASKKLIAALVASGQLNPPLAQILLKQVNKQKRTLGVITPWEYLHVLVGNYFYPREDIQFPFQHGPENRTPYLPESLNKPALHFIQGQILMTENEAELLDTVPLLENHLLHIHPKWMEPAHSTYPEQWRRIAKEFSYNGNHARQRTVRQHHR